MTKKKKQVQATRIPSRNARRAAAKAEGKRFVPLHNAPVRAGGRYFEPPLQVALQMMRTENVAARMDAAYSSAPRPTGAAVTGLSNEAPASTPPFAMPMPPIGVGGM